MTPATAGVLAFACGFGGAVAGMGLARILPRHHLEGESRDVIRLAMATVATMTALVLGLMIAAAKGSFDERASEFKHASVQAAVLDRVLAAYGPEAAQARRTLREVIGVALQQFDAAFVPEDEPRLSRTTTIGAIQSAILPLRPSTDDQRWLKTQALDIAIDIARTRWLLIEPSEGYIQSPFLLMVMFWLAVMFVSFGMFAPVNASVTVAFLLTALSIAGAIFVILEMDQPYGGLIRVSDAPMRQVLEGIAQP
jgi:hypothetical protein